MEDCPVLNGLGVQQMHNYSNNNLIRLLDHCFCSGFGQFHTNAPEAKNRTPYTAVTWADIYQMMIYPPSTAKHTSQWVIFSDQYEEDGRNAKHLRESGRFSALWLDVDETSHTIKDIKKFVLQLNCLGFIYTTASATYDAQKFRVIIPLAEPVYGWKFERLQTILNNQLEQFGISPDRANQRANQVCYLPNKGFSYEYAIVETCLTGEPCGLLNPTSYNDELERLLEEERIADSQMKARRETARLKTIERMATGKFSPIDAFNEAYSVDMVLQSYGYIKQGKRWISPLSQSGVPGVTVKDSKWYTNHQSDIDAGLNKMGDAFDLFKFYQHDNKQDSALKRAGEMFTDDRGQTLTEANRSKFMEAFRHG